MPFPLFFRSTARHPVFNTFTLLNPTEMGREQKLSHDNDEQKMSRTKATAAHKNIIYKKTSSGMHVTMSPSPNSTAL